jgi:hypothetical protein
MSQIRITKPRRTASAGRRGRREPPLPLDLRDPDITRAKRLQRQARPQARGIAHRRGSVFTPAAPLPPARTRRTRSASGTDGGWR